jgi:hypothetical protein
VSPSWYNNTGSTNHTHHPHPNVTEDDDYIYNNNNSTATDDDQRTYSYAGFYVQSALVYLPTWYPSSMPSNSPSRQPTSEPTGNPIPYPTSAPTSTPQLGHFGYVYLRAYDSANDSESSSGDDDQSAANQSHSLIVHAVPLVYCLPMFRNNSHMMETDWDFSNNDDFNNMHNDNSNSNNNDYYYEVDYYVKYICTENRTTQGMIIIW